ncbi:MAG: hypothetical protein K0Q72_236 [Armatimonadetes bacterium]|nr:hypothetical protein [Armatimonadota bacterium]
MPELSLLQMQILIGVAGVAVLLLAYWIMRVKARRRLTHALRVSRPWQRPTLERWVKQGWLDPELLGALPAQIAPMTVLYEWARVDPQVTREWRLREPVVPETPFEAVIRDVWRNLSDAEQARAAAVLAKAVTEAGPWWGGAERGWNGRPLSVLASAIGKKQQDLPLLGMEDLTAAPLPGAINAAEAAGVADGEELVLMLAALRRTTPRFMHPLAPKSSPTSSLVAGMSAQVGTDIGRRIGAGLGAALGPIGSMVGQYVGGLAGAMGGKALVKQALPERITAALKETETALAALGRLAETDDFARAARQPADRILELGKQVESIREARSRGLRERLWPSAGLIAVEVTLRVTLAQLQDYRTAADFFIATARKAPEPVAGGMVLQNPWMVRSIPGAVEKLNTARSTLNRAAGAIRGGEGSA